MTSNETEEKVKPAHRFDPDFTRNVINAIGPKATPRTRFVMGKLLQHLHDFTREVELTIDEWIEGMQFMNEVGHIYFTSDKTRNEMHRLSDITGLESLVDEIAHKHADESGEIPTSSSILGPFWSPDAPFRENGDTIVISPHQGYVCWMYGTVRDLETGKAIPNAIVDIWEASSNGKYDFQDPEKQVPNNLRGKFRTREDGSYGFYCLKPTAYSLPTNGPAFKLLNAMDRHPMRPAHIHLMVSADGYKQVVTQIFPSDDQWLKTDSVFAVKPDLIFDFPPSKDPKADVDLHCDLILAPKGNSGNNESTKMAEFNKRA